MPGPFGLGVELEIADPGQIRGEVDRTDFPRDAVHPDGALGIGRRIMHPVNKIPDDRGTGVGCAAARTPRPLGHLVVVARGLVDQSGGVDGDTVDGAGDANGRLTGPDRMPASSGHHLDRLTAGA